MSNAGFDNDVFHLLEHCAVVDVVLFHPVLQLEEIPLRSILIVIYCVFGSALYVVVCLFVDRVVCKMNESLVQVLGVVGILLRGKSNQSFFEHEYLKWFETCNNYIDSHIILVAIYQMWVGNVLAHHIS